MLPAPAAAALTAYCLTAAGSGIPPRLTLLLALPLTVAGFIMGCIAAQRARQPARQRSDHAVFVWLSAMATVRRSPYASPASTYGRGR